MQREAEAGNLRKFDVLVVDAFSGDSIPTHLLTREAMAVYVKHLAPDGVIVFQATNRFVGIAPVVERLAAALAAVTASENSRTSQVRRSPGSYSALTLPPIGPSLSSSA